MAMTLGTWETHVEAAKNREWIWWNFIVRRIELLKLGELVVNCTELERWTELQRAPKVLSLGLFHYLAILETQWEGEKKPGAHIFCAHCFLRTVLGMFIYVICGFQSAWSSVFLNISFHKPNVSNSSCDGETWKKMCAQQCLMFCPQEVTDVEPAKHNHFDRWLAPPGSVSKKLKVFLWDCLRFQKARALFLSAIIMAEVRCHLLCD